MTDENSKNGGNESRSLNEGHVILKKGWQPTPGQGVLGGYQPTKGESAAPPTGGGGGKESESGSKKD
jgi:hypothetical protein